MIKAETLANFSELLRISYLIISQKTTNTTNKNSDRELESKRGKGGVTGRCPSVKSNITSIKAEQTDLH